MEKWKELLAASLRGFGCFLYYFLFYGCVFVPLCILGWAWWLRLIISAAVILLSLVSRTVTDIVTMAFWLLSFFIILDKPFSTLAIVVYAVVGVFYLSALLYRFVLGLIYAFSDR